MVIPAERFGRAPGIVSTTRFWKNTNVTADGRVAPARSILCFVHGAAYHGRGGGVFRLASELGARGHACVTFDCEGHGTSSGLPGLVVSFDRFAVQVTEAIAFARSRLSEAYGDASVAGEGRGSGAPAFLVGESMGAATVVRTAELFGSAVAGIVLLAPMCGIAASMMPAPCVVSLLRCLACCCPGWAVVPVESHLPHLFRHDAAVLMADAEADMLRWHGRPRLGTGLQYLTVMGHVKGAGPDIDAPLLLVHGTADVVTEPAVSRAFFESYGAEDRTYVGVEGAWHVLSADDLDVRVFLVDVIDEWVAERCAGRAGDGGGAAGDGAAAAGEVAVEVGSTAATAGPRAGGVGARAPRVLEARGSTGMPALPEGGGFPALAAGQSHWWGLDGGAVEGGGLSSSTSGGLRLHLLEGPRLPAGWGSGAVARGWGGGAGVGVASV